MKDLQKFKGPDNFTFVNSPNNSNEKVKYIKTIFYFIALMVMLILISSTYTKIFGRTFSCTYKGNGSYDCILKLSDDGRFGERYNNIVSAFMDYSEEENRVGYKDVNGKMVYQTLFTFSWMNNTKLMEKDVKALNAKFSKNENFVYDLKNNRYLPFRFLFFISIPFILLFVFYYYIANYVNRKISSHQHKSVLKRQVMGKLNEAEQRAIFEQLFKEEQQAEMNIYDNSREAKDRAFRDQDIDDLTKQFYDDGK